MTFQRILQTLSLTAFLLLLWLAAFPLPAYIPVDAFLQMDPLIPIGSWISARTWIPALTIAMLVLLLTFFLGRFFCGTLCPLGTTIDVADRLCSPPSGSHHHPASGQRWRWAKYAILTFIIAGGLVGISWVFLASPLSLITRFYGLLIYPVVALLGDTILAVVQPLAVKWDWPVLAYTDIDTHRYALQWFTVVCFALIFAGARIAPRFWCRCICPTGAMLALCATRPVIKRHVTDACIECGMCQKDCPMNAIPEDPFRTRHTECIVCQTCVNICPTDAVQFNLDQPAGSPRFKEISLHRRKLMWAGISGMGASLISLTSLNNLYGQTGTGQVLSPELIRPPGALPERDFLARCVRCGECLKACPTNTLQPLGLTAGLSAFYSPKAVPRRGPCEPLCNVCGHVCPTDAIRPLPQDEKIWAKIGTAYVIREKCLAWELGRKCLICDEVCPYNAVEFKKVAASPVAVPFVHENKCSGCGFCEHYCPVRARAAIVVEPMDEIRLEDGSYRRQGQRQGLSLRLRAKTGAKPAVQFPATYTQPEGISDQDVPGLPPGFSE